MYNIIFHEREAVHNLHKRLQKINLTFSSMALSLNISYNVNLKGHKV